MNDEQRRRRLDSLTRSTLRIQLTLDAYGLLKELLEEEGAEVPD